MKALLRRRGAAGAPRPCSPSATYASTPPPAASSAARTRYALTAKEFAVLEQLALRAGEVVCKAEILEHVWDFAYDGDPNIVEVYISTLRRKLGAASIVTVRGAGYRLEAAG